MKDGTLPQDLTDHELQEVLACLLEQEHMPRKELAGELGVSTSTISRWRSGLASPNPTTRQKLVALQRTHQTEAQTNIAAEVRQVLDNTPDLPPKVRETLSEDLARALMQNRPWVFKKPHGVKDNDTAMSFVFPAPIENYSTFKRLLLPLLWLIIGR